MKVSKSFLQKVILTDGSTITIKTTSPIPVMKLTKDTRNHLLWNPKSAVETNGEKVSKFAAKFGKMDFI